jgi:predicted AlkP superfamily pyrophosphatase or phosphodiesterase
MTMQLKKWLILAGVILGSGILRAQAQPLVTHVVLVTIDGCRPDFYLDSSWHADNIRALMAGGAYAKGVNSVFPSMTYPSHTTIVTGVQPAKHGIYYNTGPGEKVYWNDSSIKVPTIWGAATAKGMTVASLFWPVSADAPVAYDIPDIGSLGEKVREQYSKPAGFVDEVRAKVFDGVSHIEYGRDVNVAKIAAYVIGKARPNLMTIHLFSVDHNEHMQGREGDLVRAAVRGADSAVGIIVDAVKAAGIADSTVVIVTGDHGFMTVTKQVNPNVWLQQAGLITDLKQDQWRAMFYSVGGSSYLYVKDREALSKVQHILRDLPDTVKQYVRVIDKKELDKIGGNPEVGLALSGLNGAAFGNAVDGPAVRPGKGGQHGYFPDFFEIRTGYVANGPGIRKGAVIEEMNQRDQAVIVARLLGLDLPSADGKVPKGLFISR